MNCRRLPFIVLFALITRVVTAQGPLPSPILPPGPAASPSASAETPPVSTATAELTRADLEPFLDGLIDSQLRNRDVAGAVVAVVKDGEVLLAKGYGFADFQQKKPVSAEETLFRPGSIAKLFTAIAVMQLVEQGKLDLDRDIRDYLDFEIPRKFPEPITLRRILTHTPGFEESVKNLFGSGDALPARDYLVAHMPAQIFPPGAVPAYSNYGLGLAGYIVERISGEAFVDYLEKHIFAPLGMASSTFKQRLPEALEARMSMGYNRGSKRPKPFEICNPPPAGALSTTGTDMTRFMIALLNGGTLDGASILQPDTLRMMQTRQNELHPQLRAMGIGFIEYSQNGQTMWGHGGDTLAFHSDMFLIPEARFGFYISYNSAGNRPGSGRGEVQRALLDRYFPRSDSPAGLSVSEAVAHGREVTGMYELSRRSETNALRVGALLGQVAVKTDRDGILTIENSKNIRGQLKRWREIAPYFYREIDGPDRVAFRRDANGQVREMLPNVPFYIGQKVSGLRSKALLLPLVGGSLAFIVLTVLLWPVAGIVRRRYPRMLAPDATTRWMHRLSHIVCLFIIGTIAVLAYPFSKVGEDVTYLGDRIDPWLTASHVLGWISCAGLLLLVATAFRFWRAPGASTLGRVHSTVLTVAALVFLLFAWQWHLLSPSLKF